MIFEVNNKDEWHEFFPIFPRQVGDQFVWFEKCLRRRKYIGYAIDDMSGRSEYQWEYALLGTVKSYQVSLDEKEWVDILHSSVHTALANGYTVRTTTQ